MHKGVVCLFAFIPAFVAAQEAQNYQIKWESDSRSGYFASFSATASEANSRLDLAKIGNPSTRLSLVNEVGRRKTPSYPQEYQTSPRVRRAYLFSVAAFNAVNILDVTSSYGKRELNPLLSGGAQRFDMTSVSRKLAMVGVINASQIITLRHRPAAQRTLAIANFVMTGVLAAVVAHNYGVSAHPAH